MKKVLTICSINSDANGGFQCSNRNIETITDIYGERNTIHYKLSVTKASGVKQLLIRLVGIVYGYFSGFDCRQEQEIVNRILKYHIDIIYIDRSIYGRLAKVIKQRFPDVRVITFFHNCEFEYSINSLLAKRNYLGFYIPLLAYQNEKIACKYSDELIVLNKRDEEALSKHYGRTPKYIIPITFKPWYKPQNLEKPITNPMKALFVGSYFYGNTEGLKWFCKNILPNVSIHFTIVGSGMEKLKSEIPASNKLSIYGKAPDLSEYYENADFVILPILSGGGMKVKTAEALMFGKYIVGTPEAFTGYDVNSSTATICTSVQDFIDVINSLSLETKFNKPSRELFESKYSYQNSLEIFRKVLQ